jgi:hypothetical protein
MARDQPGAGPRRLGLGSMPAAYAVWRRLNGRRAGPVRPRRSCRLVANPNHRSRRATEDVGDSVSESMQDESALASLDLAGLESLRSICSSTALTELLADFRVRRPASVSSAWSTRWCCG